MNETAAILPLKPTRTDFALHLNQLALMAEATGDEQLARAFDVFSATTGLDKLAEVAERCRLEATEADNKLLKGLKSIHELEVHYRAFTKQAGALRFSFSNWLPSLKVRPLVPGELAVIVADTATGKTTIAQNWIRHAHPLTCVMFQLELPTTVLFERYLSMEIGVDGEAIFESYKSGEAPKLSFDKLKHVWTWEKSAVTPDEIQEVLTKAEYKIGKRPALVFIDYIGLIGGKGTTRYERVSTAIETFKQMAKNLGMIFVVLAQMSRPENKDVGDPKLHSAKDSGSIEASAGLVLGLTRDAKNPSSLKIKVIKSSHRGGGQVLDCQFHFPSMRITECAKSASVDEADADAARQYAHRTGE